MPTTRSRPPGSRQPSRAATPRTGTCRTPVPPHRRTRSDEEAMLIRLRLGDERGVALVVALLVSFVVLLLGTAVVSVSSGPSTATYEASIEVFNAAGAEIACPPSGTSAVAAMITSTGRSGSTLARTMQSYVRMSPIYGGWSAAIFANTPTTIGQRMTINSASGSEGDVFVNGDLTLSNNITISGNLYVSPAGAATGALTMSNQVTVQSNVWANGNVTMSNGTVTGDVTSSTGNISVSNPATIQGDATAAGTVGSASQISGLITPGYTQGPPPGQALPQIAFSASEQQEWTNAGYVIMTFSGSSTTPCNNAKTFIANVSSGVQPAGNYVVRVISTSGTPCKISYGNNSSTNVRGNLAIITDGDIRREDLQQHGLPQHRRDGPPGRVPLLTLHRLSLQPERVPGSGVRPDGEHLEPGQHDFRTHHRPWGQPDRGLPPGPRLRPRGPVVGFPTPHRPDPHPIGCVRP